jgi:transcriptional regulator with XRE-family HTH domain
MANIAMACQAIFWQLPPFTAMAVCAMNMAMDDLEPELARIRERLTALRNARKLSMEALGSLIGTDASTVNKLEKGKLRISDVWIVKLAKALGVSAAALFTDSPQGKTEGSADLRHDLPIRGTAAGRHLRGGDFSLEKPVGQTWRPPNLRSAEDAYAFIVARSSMEPEFHDGALHIANPGRPAAPGDPVVVLTRFRPDGPVEATLGRLVEESETRVAVEKRQPPGSVTEFVPGTVIRVDRVLTSNEVFGV